LRLVCFGTNHPILNLTEIYVILYLLQTSMSSLKILTEKHNLISETKFQLKSFILILYRQLRNSFTSLKSYKIDGRLKNGPVVASSATDLWNNEDTEKSWMLTAGKVHNLRLAAKKLNGIEVEAGKIFSFWQHLGNPNLWKGYVIGREIREGCIIPTIAGGLCQLSNALYDAALKANFNIIERHRHTKVIKGSLAEKDRDATVKWNYVDLRFQSENTFRIEIELTQDNLLVQFRSREKPLRCFTETAVLNLQPAKLNDCYSCGNFKCFKHPDPVVLKKEKAITCFVLDEKWSEFDRYIKTTSTKNDYFIVPLLKNLLIKTNRYNWANRNPQKTAATPFAAIHRALSLRITAIRKRNIFSKKLQLDKKLAKAAAKKIPVESTHLVVSQNLLPFLWEEGVFGGRSFDVLMNRLPVEKLHERLDIAFKNYPESKTLNDFRAPRCLIDTENIALTKSRHIITAHTEIAGIFTHKTIKLDWTVPDKMTLKKTAEGKILFPASALGRNGAHEMKRLASALDLSIVLLGKATESTGFWKGIAIGFAGNNPLENICLVVYPAYVAQQPRLLLKALAAGIPVITTTASGLNPQPNLTIVPVGDYEKLKEEVIKNIH
jgi:hypothetical protein